MYGESSQKWLIMSLGSQLKILLDDPHHSLNVSCHVRKYSQLWTIVKCGWIIPKKVCKMFNGDLNIITDYIENNLQPVVERESIFIPHLERDGSQVTWWWTLLLAMNFPDYSYFLPCTYLCMLHLQHRYHVPVQASNTNFPHKQAYTYLIIGIDDCYVILN